jgi:hypothetical protein
MPTFVNTNSHPVRVRDEDGVEQRVLPGQVVDASGAYADRLKSTGGVDTANAEQKRAYADRDTGDVTAGPARRLRAKNRLGPMRVAIRHATIAAPLRRVVGDDQAPFGPGTGTVTTKAGADDPAHFEPNEARPIGEVEGGSPIEAGLPSSAIPTSPDIHNAQVDNAEKAEAVAEEIAADEGNSEDALDEDEGGQEQS